MKVNEYKYHTLYEFKEDDIKQVLAEKYNCSIKQVVLSFSPTDGFEAFINIRNKDEKQERKTE